MAQDPWDIIQDSLKSLRSELSSLTDKLHSSVNEIWIKLTELDTTISLQSKWRSERVSTWRWLVPLIISIISVLITIFATILDLDLTWQRSRGGGS